MKEMNDSGLKYKAVAVTSSCKDEVSVLWKQTIYVHVVLLPQGHFKIEIFENESANCSRKRDNMMI